MVFLCFEPEPSLIKDLKLWVTSMHLIFLGNGRYNFWNDHFWYDQPLLHHNGPQLNLHVISAPRLCAPDVER